MKWTLIIITVNQVAVILEALYDIHMRKRKGKATHHFASAVFRGLAWCIAAIVLHWKCIPAAVILAHLLGCQYWLTFNPIYNKFDGAHWWYGNKGFFDSILSGESNRYRNLAMKLYLVLMFSYLYFSFYANC